MLFVRFLAEPVTGVLPVNLEDLIRVSESAENHPGVPVPAYDPTLTPGRPEGINRDTDGDTLKTDFTTGTEKEKPETPPAADQFAVELFR